MKKFKIIEKSRFLKEEDMHGIRGGQVVVESCSNNDPYKAKGCNNVSYQTCGTSMSNTYKVYDSCGPATASYAVCGKDANYRFTDCSGESNYTFPMLYI